VSKLDDDVVVVCSKCDPDCFHSHGIGAFVVYRNILHQVIDAGEQGKRLAMVKLSDIEHIKELEAALKDRSYEIVRAGFMEMWNALDETFPGQLAITDKASEAAKLIRSMRLLRELRELVLEATIWESGARIYLGRKRWSDIEAKARESPDLNTK
jgi:hypothetical protein